MAARDPIPPPASLAAPEPATTAPDISRRSGVRLGRTASDAWTAWTACAERVTDRSTTSTDSSRAAAGDRCCRGIAAPAPAWAAGSDGSAGCAMDVNVIPLPRWRVPPWFPRVARAATAVDSRVGAVSSRGGGRAALRT